MYCLSSLSLSLSLSIQYCEYCRLNSGCFLDTNETKQCQDTCGSDSLSIPDPQLLLQSQSDLLSKNYLLNEFGQIFYSQFIGTIPLTKLSALFLKLKLSSLTFFFHSRRIFTVIYMHALLLYVHRRRGVSSGYTMVLWTWLQSKEFCYNR